MRASTLYLPSAIFLLLVMMTSDIFVHAQSPLKRLVKRATRGGDAAAGEEGRNNSAETQDQTRVPGGGLCDELYPKKFTLDEESNTAVFSDRSLSRFVNRRIPKGMVIDDGDSEEYKDVYGALFTYWKCVNQLAFEGYRITGIDRLDIRTLFRIGNLSYSENVGKPGDQLAYWIAFEPDIFDTTLPLRLLSSGPAYSEIPITFGLALLRRLIPTRATGTLNQIRTIHSIHEFTTYPGYEYKYPYAENEEDMLAKSVKVGRAFKNAIRRWKTRKPDEINTKIKKFTAHAWVLAFQADNEVVLRMMLEVVPNLDSDELICATVATIKLSAFYHEPITKFPRIKSWYQTLRNGTCPSLAPLYDPNANEVTSELEVQTGNSARPGGSACNGFHFETDVSTKTATFGNTFLSGHLNALLPPGKKIIQPFSLNYNVTRDGLQKILKCINNLSRQNYTSNFSPQDIKRFSKTGAKQSSPTDLNTHPINIFITLMVHDRQFVDTSLAFALIRSGVLNTEPVMTLLCKVTPTQLMYANRQLSIREYFRDTPFIHESQDTDSYYGYVGNMYYAANDTFMRAKSLELIDALESGLVSAFKDKSNAAANLQALMSILVHLVQLAFFADNEIVLQEATRNEFIRTLAEKTGTLKYGLRHMPTILEAYRLMEDDVPILTNLFLRLKIAQSDKDLVMKLKKHPEIRSRPFELFPRIKKWQTSRD